MIQALGLTQLKYNLNAVSLRLPSLREGRGRVKNPTDCKALFPPPLPPPAGGGGFSA